MDQHHTGQCDVMVIFGITGDLARKMTLRALYGLEQRGLLTGPIIGVAGREISQQAFIQWVHASITESGEVVHDAVFERLAGRLTYVDGDVTEPALYESLAETIGPDRAVLFYLETPPSLFAPIVENLAKVGLLTNSRVAVEKPFGHDLNSARDLNARLRTVLDEDQILRVDHFLGKQPVLEVECLRFANHALAGLWDRNSIAEIHITMAENFGVEDRGKFYDAVGTLRDVVQNHLLQVLAVVAMEPPVGASANDLNDKKTEVLRSMPTLTAQHYVRGQYRGYTAIAGVAEHSTTETFVALRAEIDNWRWTGVPIFLRAGKAMPHKVTEVRLFMRRGPHLPFLAQGRPAEPNQIVLRIDPDPGFRIRLSGMGGHTWRDIHLDSSFAADLGPAMKPYERLLHAGLIGDRQLFAREDSIEETWRIVEPLLDRPGAPHVYEPGSWGPDAANTLLRGHHRWHQPWMPATSS